MLNNMIHDVLVYVNSPKTIIPSHFSAAGAEKAGSR